MKERYFIKYLATFLIPLLIPLLILGSLSFVTTQHNMKADINRSSQHLLTQSQRQIEMILDELDTLNLALYQNAKVFNELSAVLQNPVYTYESSTAYQIISSYLNALTSSKPYIHSFYFYVDNENNRFISSLDGLSHLDAFHDTGWYDAFMRYDGPPRKWTSRREVRLYEFESEPTGLVSLYNVLAPRKIAIILNIRPRYFENLLHNITTYNGQKLFILDEQDQVIFSNVGAEPLEERELKRIADNPLTYFDLALAAGKASVTKVESARNNWKYVSVIPHESLYETPTRILSYTVAFAGLAFLFGLFLTFYLTRRNYRQLLSITALIRSAENNRAPLKPPAKVNDEYSYIIQNMIAHFIEHRYIRTQLSEKKYRLQVMELLALQSQINPHFLYNTLHSIYWETVGLTGKPNKASEMIEHLSDMLSYSFSDPTTSVTWDEEIANTINYINIQRQRYKDKFDCFFEYDEGIRELPTMKLLLQPLVENSLYHGIKEKEAPGLIKIKIARRDGRLRVAVIDNGCGMPADKLKDVREALRRDNDEQMGHTGHTGQKGHIGLANTNKRLKLMYGDRSELRIKSRPGRGTVVTVEVPA